MFLKLDGRKPRSSFASQRIIMVPTFSHPVLQIKGSGTSRGSCGVFCKCFVSKNVGRKARRVRVFFFSVLSTSGK